MDKVRLGLIGCGAGASALYGDFFRYLENGELVACMDVVKNNAEKLASQTGAKKVYTELDPLLEDKGIDAVIIITPTNLHAEQVVKAAQAKKHIYCEKPMTTTIGEADRMIVACTENNVKLQIAFMKRFNKSFHLVKQILDNGKLGDIFELRATWDNARTQTSAQANYRHRLVSGGGYLQEDGSHPVDVCRWFMGDVAEVTGHVMMVASNRFENDDLDLVVMKHKNGGMSSLHITMLTHRRGVESYEIFGTKGTLLMEWQFHSTHSLEPAIVHIHEKSVKKQDLTLYTSWNPHEELIKNWQYLGELRYFCDCIIHDKEPEIGGAEGRAIVEIINAAYISSREGVTIKLPLDRSPDFKQIFSELAQRSRWAIPDEETWWSRY